MKDIAYGISEDIGWRSRMENAHAVVCSEEQNFCLAAVFDGHLDPRAAQAAAEVLPRFVEGSCLDESEKPEGPRRSYGEMINQACLKTDEYIIKKGIRSGTTAGVLVIAGEEFWAANSGDTRVIIESDAGGVVLTQDHRPDLPAERARIESQGGRVIELDVPRVEGDLALSRALGDVYFKPYVTPLPRIVYGLLGRENRFAVVACDGVWVSLSTEEACSIVRNAPTPQKAAELIQQEAFWGGSDDNISVIVLDLEKYIGQLPREKMSILNITDTAAPD